MSEEARTGKRFPLELPIKIHGEGGDDSATTGNMSAAGVYIMADLNLAVGSNIEFDITLATWKSTAPDASSAKTRARQQPAQTPIPANAKRKVA
jgi:hypothetical protein